MAITVLNITFVYARNLKNCLIQETQYKTLSHTFDGRRTSNVAGISIKYEAL
jgi:hypothetical protein